MLTIVYIHTCSYIMKETIYWCVFTLEISPWTGRFYSLLDPSYAKNNIPIIASVSEHQPTTWSSFYFDLQFLVFMFPGKPYIIIIWLGNTLYVLFLSFFIVGLYFCFSKLTDANVFIIMYGVTSVYFAVSSIYIKISPFEMCV